MVASSSIITSSNISHKENAPSGDNALFSNTASGGNTAIGAGALYSNTTGNFNTGIGYQAGFNATTGSNNIYIGSGVEGTSSDNQVIRIGLEGTQTQTYIAGIYGASIGTGSAVYVNSNGQLDTGISSRRLKEDIQNMGGASSRLMKLRPVTFHYKPQLDQEERVLQYGLIAEEVAEVYPELVQYEKSGEPLTVRYHELGPMLLNEVQKQQEHMQKQDDHINQLNQALNDRDVSIQSLEKLLGAVGERIAVMESPAKTVASKYGASTKAESGMVLPFLLHISNKRQSEVVIKLTNM